MRQPGFLLMCIGACSFATSHQQQLSLMQTEVEPPRLEFILWLRWGWLRLFLFSPVVICRRRKISTSLVLVAPMTTTCSRRRWQPLKPLLIRLMQHIIVGVSVDQRPPADVVSDHHHCRRWNAERFYCCPKRQSSEKAGDIRGDTLPANAQCPINAAA